jgi:hypothetical protein
MNFKDTIIQLSERAEKLRHSLSTEEATKTSLVLPFIQALGYDIFNPMEVVPEFTCDVGTKKGEKVDYAVLKDGAPVILIECKHCDQDLEAHGNQLLRYFSVSKAKFGVLTNGLIYRFYTDLYAPNKMDETPFLEVDMLSPKDNQIDELKKFHKSCFDVEKILDSAEELRITGDVKAAIISEFQSPTPEFVKFLIKKFSKGVVTQKMIDWASPFVKKSFDQYVNDLVNETLASAIKSRQKKEEPEIREELPEGVVYMSDDGAVVTTQEELDGFNIVRAILYEIVDVSRITYRDAQSYFSVLFDDNNRKPVCRLYFNGKKKYVATFDREKKEKRNDINSLNDIYRLSDELKTTVKFYLNI